MSKRVHIVLCWLLTLTLTGLPLASYAYSPRLQADSEHCNHETAGDMQHGDGAHHQAVASAALQTSAQKACCAHCDDNGDCNCNTNLACHSTGSQHSPAILPAASYNNQHMRSIFAAFTLADYHSCDIEPEIIPPII